MSYDNISALKKFLEFFATKGLQRLSEESIIVAKKEVGDVYKQMDATGDLPEDTHKSSFPVQE